METKVKITPTIKNAIIQAIEANGGQSALERKTGVSQRNLSKYISEQTESITSAIWSQLEPALRPYLPGDVINAGVIGSGRIYGPVIGKAGSVVQRHAGASPEELAACRASARAGALDEVLDAVMESDIDDAAKIRFYGILKQLKKGE